MRYFKCCKCAQLYISAFNPSQNCKNTYTEYVYGNNYMDKLGLNRIEDSKLFLLFQIISEFMLHTYHVIGVCVLYP